MTYTIGRAVVPRVFHKILPRNQIAGIIEDASLSEAIYMVAPYGCGKTLATLSWLQARNRRSAWITLDETDNAESAIAELIAASLAPFAQHPGDKDFLTNPCNFEDMQLFLTEIVSRVINKSITADTLVIDNFHYLKDASLLRAIKDFIYSLLGHVRVIVMSRAELSPIFNDLILKGHICLITTKELSLNMEEITEYFTLNRRSSPSQNLAQIHQDTEGWPAAINVVLTTSRDGSIQYGEDARAYVKGFFESEIWDGLEETTKDFLLRTSLLDILTPTACRAITGIGATLPILGWLFTNGLFISRLDRDTYCYHRVFKDYLLDKLETSDIDEKSLYKEYAWWLFENKEFKRSFPCFFRVRDLYGINQVLKVINPATMNSIDEFLDVVDCLTTLDISDLKPYPVIVARIALIEYLKGNIARFQSLYHTLTEWIEPGLLPVSPQEYAEYIWEVGWLCYLDPEESVDDNAKHREWCNYSTYVPHLKDLHLSRAAVLRFPSVLRGIRDYSGVPAHEIESVIKRNQVTESRFIHEEHSLWEMNLILAEELYESEKFTQAEEIVRRVMALADERRYTDFYFICAALLVKLLRATHNAKEIGALIDRLESIIKRNEDYFLLQNFHAFRLRNRLADGQIGFDAVFENENKKYQDKPYYHLLYRQIAYVRGLLSTGEYNEAVLILGNLELLCQKYKRVMDLIEINILKAIALHGLGGHEEETSHHMMKALAEAKKYGYIRIFSDDAKALWPILELASKKISGNYIKKVILSCKKELIHSGYKPSQKNEKQAKLTKTELKILKCLQLGMSYKDIEVDNSIKESTVKSHVHSIYSKLDVSNRTSAIIAAQQQGIID